VGPDQRFLGVLDTSPFRIAIVYSIVFACGAAALLGAVDFAVSRVVDSSTDNLIEAEVQGLREQMVVLSRSDFIELIEQRSQDQDVRGAVYLMVDPQLRPVAGNVPAWPKIAASQGKWFLFKVSVPFGDETREHEMRAQRFRLPGGYNMLVGHDVQERQDVKNLMMRGLIAAVVMTLLLGLGGGFWMGRRILAQAGAISAVATQIMRGDLSQRLPVRDADDEINTLAREINTMLDKIEQLTLGMRTVLDSAAHDLRTPLNRLQATAEGAMMQLGAGSAERRVLEQAPLIREIARHYARSGDFLFLGRLSLFPIALEGALKLKEISYIHAEGYPAAEMKHGPIALVSEKCPSVFLAPKGELFNKIVSSMQEIKARKGPIIAVATEGTEIPAGVADAVIPIPDCHEAVLPIVAAVPVQLLSYYIAVERGCDVDKPRNLAKSVTVE